MTLLWVVFGIFFISAASCTVLACVAIAARVRATETGPGYEEAASPEAAAEPAGELEAPVTV